MPRELISVVLVNAVSVIAPYFQFLWKQENDSNVQRILILQTGMTSPPRTLARRIASDYISAVLADTSESTTHSPNL